MDFTKFVSLLEKQALFFARADKLGDPFEGSVTKVNAAAARVPRDELQQFRKKVTRWTLINCWHENAHESEAMWKLYARETDGIAIKTDFKSLSSSFTCREDVFIGIVNYIDYDRHLIPADSRVRD